jgi:uncharacterized protein YcbX
MHPSLAPTGRSEKPGRRVLGQWLPVTSLLGRVAALTRYPVKSVAGQELAVAHVGPRGVDGDRAWALYTEDGGIGSGKTTRRFRRVDGLLGLAATADGGAPVVTVPDGRSAVAGSPEADGLVSEVLGRPLRLAAETDVPHHDEAPVHVVTTAALRRVEQLLGAPVAVSRFRANVVVDVPGTGFPEDGWAGGLLELGDHVVLRPDGGMVRCRMVDLVGGGTADDRLLKLLGRERDTVFGVRALVERGGTVRVGDVVRRR